MQSSEFSTVFAGLGYGVNDHCEGGTRSVYVPVNDDPGRGGNHGGLSYCTEIAEVVSLLVLDTGIYRTDSGQTSRYGLAQQTPGDISPDFLRWAKEQARAAGNKGNLVLMMCHHGLLPHYKANQYHNAKFFMNQMLIPNGEKIAKELSEAGVTAVFTGHSHASDIAMYQYGNNVIYDIETGAMCAYPCPWRIVDIEIRGEGENRTCQLTINTTPIDDILPEVNTSNWKFVLSENDVRTFNEYYNKSLQAYTYQKTGISKSFLEPLLDYFAKGYIYDAVKHEGCIKGYLACSLGVRDVGAYAQNRVCGLLDSMQTLERDISILGSNAHLKLTKESGAPERAEYKFELKLTIIGNVYRAAITLNLSRLGQAVNELLENAQNQLAGEAWMNNNYARQIPSLVNEVIQLIVRTLQEPMNTPLEGGNPNTVPLFMLNDAWQAFAGGDEDLPDPKDPDKQARWAHERELMGTYLGENIADRLWKEIGNLTKDDEQTPEDTRVYPEVTEQLMNIQLGTTERPLRKPKAILF